jgi:hypothetical protein
MFSKQENTMSVIASLKLIEFKPENAQGRIFMRRRKLADKIDQQISLASDPAYAPMKLVTVTDSEGNQQRKEVAKRIKRWWVANSDGTVQLTVRYGSKPLELAKGKNAIQCADIKEVGTVLGKVKEAVMNGELDTMLASVTVVGRKVSKS